MAITLRNRKGSPLTQQELDVNFTEFFYSSSLEGSLIKFHRFQYDSSSNNFSASIAFPIDPPSGLDGYIQLKKGNAPSGSEATLTASADFSFDYQNSILQVTGSSNISGDLVVGGTVTAQEFKSELVSSSIVYQSGSTKFGDSDDDVHNRTGSFYVKGVTFLNGDLGINGITNVKTAIYLLNSSASLHESEINQLQTDSGSFSTRVTDLELFSSSLDATYTTDVELNASSSDLTTAYTLADTNLSSSLVTTVTNLSSSLVTRVTNLSSSVSSTYLLNTTDTLEGDLTVTGTLTAQEFNTEYISSSIIFESGSTKFGDTADDTHTFTGSVNISQDITVVGNITGNITGSASNASTASYVLGTQVDGAVTLATTSSYVLGSSVDGAVTLASTSSTVNFNGGLTTTSDVQFDSFGVGVAASGTTGEIRATADIIAYHSSDKRLKENIEVIPDAVNKVKQIKGVSFDWKENISDVTSKTGHDIGVLAQDIEAVLPELVTTRDSGYKAVSYEKIVALLIEAIKEQQLQIDELKSK
tara:strand:+ start:1879 stop:3468 length:1590 start_codon:yes stop_codon:yes gene_type:complete